MKTASMVLTAVSVTLAAMLSLPANAQNPLGAHPHGDAQVVLAAAAAVQGDVYLTKATLRDLWIGHIFWVRNVVVAELAGDTAALQAAEEQVVANAQAIAASIEPFYGTDAKDQFFALLAGHYGAVKAYLDTFISKDDAGQSEATTKLTSNATEIAVFLSTANPYLPKDVVEGLLVAHGGHHIAQIQQLDAMDYVQEAQTWSVMTQHMYVIADATADALALQFADKF